MRHQIPSQDRSFLILQFAAVARGNAWKWVRR